MLYLSGNLISDFTALNGLKNLKDLSLGDNEFDEDGALDTMYDALEGMKKLERLNLSNSGISSVERIKTLTSLKELLLFYNRITDIFVLKELINLERLCISYNPIPKAQIKLLQAALPGCCIVHD